MISFRLFHGLPIPWAGILFLSTTNNLATQQHHHVEAGINKLGVDFKKEKKTWFFIF